ncbi:Enoyl-CoA hydratase/isomerase [Perkinsus olseni]|uniref:Enoyl-CoA hydratase/isomerase n=1 Tax=Perkinsus olseni TaxID=32597 RepID=A0A7J6PL77_PEROL|nr:Enoyl-CoA hydratase/isomerase [Perkinsus olseni]
MASRSRVEKELEQLEALVGRGEIDEARMVDERTIMITLHGPGVEKVCVAVLSLLTDANPDHGLNSNALDFYWMASITASLAGDKHEILLIALNRPSVRNAIDRPMAGALYQTLKDFDENKSAKVAIIHGCGKDFCAGADLSSISKGENLAPAISIEGDKSPLGFARLTLSKPVIAAVSGHAVAGGLELAAWCDMRIIDRTAKFGVYCRRFGVPLVDGGTINLQSLIGHSRAMDMVLTGRAVEAEEAVRWGLATRMVERTEDLVPEAIK